MDATGREMAGDGVLMSGIVPNPIGDAGKLIEAQSNLQRPPDVYLIMPLTGISNPEGVYEQYMKFGEKYGESCGARFLYYFRQKRELDAMIRLVKDSPHFIGVKIGTGVEDTESIIDGVGDSGLVVWGIGDRCTRPAELGTIRAYIRNRCLMCTRRRRDQQRPSAVAITKPPAKSKRTFSPLKRFVS